MQFNKIPKYYDLLMDGVPYRYWVSYLESVFEKVNFSPVSVLDVCCGTGTVAGILMKKKYSVAGFDLSEGMIEEAKKNYPDIDFTVQNASSFNLEKKFDCAISLFDSLNYITDKNDLQQAFYRVFIHLNRKGLFIFDMNTEYALANDLFAQVNMNEDSSVQYIWEPHWDRNTRICTVDMRFIVKETGEDFRETHIQRAYGTDEIRQMLKTAGFDKICVYNAYRFTEPDEKSDRVFFVAEKN